MCIHFTRLEFHSPEEIEHAISSEPGEVNDIVIQFDPIRYAYTLEIHHAFLRKKGLLDEFRSYFDDPPEYLPDLNMNAFNTSYRAYLEDFEFNFNRGRDHHPRFRIGQKVWYQCGNLRRAASVQKSPWSNGTTWKYAIDSGNVLIDDIEEKMLSNRY
ncbi:MAG: hypothetical protein QHC79_25770 [Pseudosphingobacterium sp.]|nr:hypothetical protein [Pseudosphingobacterium sp.]